MDCVVTGDHTSGTTHPIRIVFVFEADRNGKCRSIKKVIDKNFWQTAEKGNMTVSTPSIEATNPPR